MSTYTDDPVLGCRCCAACGKECLKNAHNWLEISQEWASQLKVDFEKANAAAGAGFTGVARLCYTCRAKCNKPKHSGRNGRKGQGKGKGIKRKIDDTDFEGPPSNDSVEVQCEVCSSSDHVSIPRTMDFTTGICLQETLEKDLLGA